MSVLRVACVLAVALWATAVVAYPSSLWNVINPTGCSSAAFTPRHPGRHNITIWDRCQGTSESAIVEVKCGWPRIPVENITVAAYPYYYYDGSEYRGVRLVAHACYDEEQREVDYLWIKRGPGTNDDNDWDDHGDDNSDFEGYEIIDDDLDIGVTSYTSVMRDGCYEYQHNISIHYDGLSVTVVPSFTPLQSRQASSPSGSNPFQVRFLDGAHDMVFGVYTDWYWDATDIFQGGHPSDADFGGDFLRWGYMERVVNYQNNDQHYPYHNFHQLVFTAHIAPMTGSGTVVPNNETESWFNLVIPDDKLVIYYDGGSDYYYVTDKAAWTAAFGAWVPVTDSANFTNNVWTSSMPENGNVIWASQFYPGNASTPLGASYSRAEYEDSTRTWIEATSNSSQFLRTERFVSPGDWEDSDGPFYNVPICRLSLSWDDNVAWVDAQPAQNNHTYNFASCVGNYRINVTTAWYWEDSDSDWWYGPGYSTDTKGFAISCGLPPEIQPALYNPKTVVFQPDAPTNIAYDILSEDWNNVGHASSVVLHVFQVADSWGWGENDYTGHRVPDYRITWSVVSEPAGSRLGADMGWALKTFLSSDNNDFIDSYSGSSSESSWSNYYYTSWVREPPVGRTIYVRPTVAGTYVFNITYWDGCQSTSVLEYLNVLCPSDRAAVSFPANWGTATTPLTYAGSGSIIWANLYTYFSDSTVPVNKYYRGIVELTSYPTNLPWIANADQYYKDEDPIWNNWFYPEDAQLYAWGPGTYKVNYVSDHGCGAVASQEITVVVQCENPSATPNIAVTDHSKTITISNSHSVNTNLEGKVTWTNTYTGSPPIFRSTWILQSYNGVAVTASEDNTRRYFTGLAAGSLQTVVDNGGVFRWKHANPNGDMDSYVPMGTYVFKYVVDDGCKSGSGTYTLTVNCATDTTVVDIYGQSDDAGMYKNVGVANRWFSLNADISGTPSGGQDYYEWSTNKPDKVYWGSGPGNAAHQTGPRLMATETGDLIVTLKYTDACGKLFTKSVTVSIVTTPPTVSNACADLTLVGSYMFYKADTATPRASTKVDGTISSTTAISIPFSHNHFPHVHLNYNATDFGTAARRTSASVFFTVKKAPAGSIYTPLMDSDEDAEFDYCWDCKNQVWDMATWMSTKKTVMARWQWSTISYPTLANTRKFQSVFLPDVAGDYTIDVLMATECKTSTPIAYWTKKTSVTFTATCPTAPTLVLKDGAGTAITTSKANPTSITLQNTHLGSEYTVLDASKSTKSDGYQIYYHWYWKSVEHGYDYDNSEWKDDHVGLGTPYSPILTLDPKLIPPSHNGRELMLTISDGCQNVTTAVKIFVQCTSENVNVLVDRSTLVLDPLYCINKVNIRTGVCINHYDIQVTVTPALVSGTAAALADQTFALNFKSVKEEDSGPNKTAIGLGIGLGLGIPILCLIGYCVYRSTKKNNIKDSA